MTCCSVEKQFSCQIQSLCWCQGQKSKSKCRTCNSSLGGLPQQPADSRWGNTTESRQVLCPPNNNSGAAGCTTRLIPSCLTHPLGGYLPGFDPQCPSALPHNKGCLWLQRNLPRHHLRIPELSKTTPYLTATTGFLLKARHITTHWSGQAEDT